VPEGNGKLRQKAGGQAKEIFHRRHGQLRGKIQLQSGETLFFAAFRPVQVQAREEGKQRHVEQIDAPVDAGFLQPSGFQTVSGHRQPYQ